MGQSILKLSKKTTFLIFSYIYELTEKELIQWKSANWIDSSIDKAILPGSHSMNCQLCNSCRSCFKTIDNLQYDISFIHTN